MTVDFFLCKKCSVPHGAIVKPLANSHSSKLIYKPQMFLMKKKTIR